MGAAGVCHNCAVPISHSEVLELGQMCRRCFNESLVNDTKKTEPPWEEPSTPEQTVVETTTTTEDVEDNDDLEVHTIDEALTILDFLWVQEEALHLLQDDFYDVLLAQCKRAGKHITNIKTRLRFCITDMFANKNSNCRKECKAVQPYVIYFANEYIKYRQMIEKGFDEPKLFIAEVCNNICDWGYEDNCYVSDDRDQVLWCMKNYQKYGEMVITDVYERLDHMALRSHDNTSVEWYYRILARQATVGQTIHHTSRRTSAVVIPRAKIMFFSRATPRPGCVLT